MSKKKTMVDVSKALNVSTMTVSKCFQNSPDISDGMRKKVLRKAREIGYVYPKKRHKNILVLTKNIYVSKDDTFYNELYLRLSEAADNRFVQLSMSILKQSISDRDVSALDFSAYHGVLLMGQFEKSFIKAIGDLNIPFACIDFYYHGIDAECIISNNFFGAFDATSHLIDLGHKNIRFVGTLQKTSSINDRYLGYQKALMEASLPCDDAVIDDRDGNGLFDHFTLPSPLPTAFVCNNDHTAHKLIQQLKSNGIEVPEAVSVTGFDDVSYAKTSSPQITTMRVSRTLMANTSLDVLLEKIDQERSFSRRTTLDCFIVDRDSTAPPKDS